MSWHMYLALYTTHCNTALYCRAKSWHCRLKCNVEHPMRVVCPRTTCLLSPHGRTDAFQLRLLEGDEAEEWGNMLENLSDYNKVLK